MRQTTLFIIVLFFLTLNSQAQDKDCFEVKYLDFFGIEELDTLKWPDSELNQLLQTDFSKNEEDKKYKTNFLIPLIVLQLKDFYPPCNKLFDTIQYNKLVQLYFNIRQQNKSVLNGKTISQQLELIRQDYYDQVLNDTLLPFMNFTLDDGPIYGEHSKINPDLGNGKSIETDFGKLIIVNSDKKIFLVATDKEKKIKWVRIMTSAFGGHLKDLEFSADSVHKTSLAYSVSMHSPGEGLTLYIKLDNEFMYYYHSW